ncbi:MAG: citrate/2-methylcitrate synthase, partial [Armatimonadota bacterium]
MSVSFQAGLRDVIAAASAICTVDGQAGRLRYRGYEIGDLAERASFEEVVHLLWFGELPGREALGRFSGSLAAERAMPVAVLDAMRGYPSRAHPLEALRTAVSHHAMFDPDAREYSSEANLRKSIRLTAQMATL